jgi:hypothetical protein
LGVSLLLLGVIVPIWTRNSTKKKHAEDLKKASTVTLDKSNSLLKQEIK